MRSKVEDEYKITRGFLNKVSLFFILNENTAELSEVRKPESSEGKLFRMTITNNKEINDKGHIKEIYCFVNC